MFPSPEEFSTVCCDPRRQRPNVVSEAEEDIFLVLSCSFYDTVDVGNLISFPLALGFPGSSDGKESSCNAGD